MSLIHLAEHRVRFLVGLPRRQRTSPSWVVGLANKLKVLLRLLSLYSLRIQVFLVFHIFLFRTLIKHYK